MRTFINFAGELVKHDTCETLRENFQRHHRLIETGQDLRATLRAGPVAWPGGYTLYFGTSDGAALCFNCVRSNLYSVLDSIRTGCADGWRVSFLINSAECDESAHCDNCNSNLGAYDDA